MSADKEHCPDKQHEDAVSVRFACIAIALLSNTTVFFYLYYKIYYSNSGLSSKHSKRYKRHQSELDPRIIRGTFVYILLASFTVLWNYLYRIIINPTQHDCRITDTIDEYLNIISRCYLLLFFTFRVELVFKHSVYAINQIFINTFRLTIIIENLTVNTIWISEMTVCPINDERYSKYFGVYCYNMGKRELIYLHFGFDTIFNLLILSIFVDRLNKVSNLIKHSLDHNGTPRISKEKEASSKQIRKIARRQTVFVLISIISTWILYLASITNVRKENNNNLTFLRQVRWFYPIDWAINVWCIALMFRFNKSVNQMFWCCLKLKRLFNNNCIWCKYCKYNKYCSEYCAWCDEMDGDDNALDIMTPVTSSNKLDRITSNGENEKNITEQNGTDIDIDNDNNKRKSVKEIERKMSQKNPKKLGNLKHFTKPLISEENNDEIGGNDGKKILMDIDHNQGNIVVENSANLNDTDIETDPHDDINNINRVEMTKRTS